MNLIATVPSHKKLQIRTIRDIANALDAKIVYNERFVTIDCSRVDGGRAGEWLRCNNS